MSSAIPSERAAEPAPKRLPSFHPSSMAVGPDGVPGCTWPLPLEELLAARDRFLSDLYAWLRLQDIDRDAEAELVWLNAAPLAMDVLRLFNAWVVVERLRAVDRLPGNGDEDASLLGRLAQGRAPDPSPHSAKTFRGLPRDPAWRKALRIAKHALGSAPIRYRPRSLIRPERDIVTFTVSPLTLAHARLSDRPVVLSRFTDWMSSGDLAGRLEGRGLREEAREAVLSLVKGMFARAGAPLPAMLEASLAALLDRLTARTRVHLEELRRHGQSLPRDFWPGTGGILYNRIFARAVQRAGGRVTGHDHSSSSGWWQAPERMVNEFNSVDRFVTYGERIAEGLRRDLDASLLAKPERSPEIVGLVGAGPAIGQPAQVATLTPQSGERRRLMYVMNLYAGDFMGLWPGLPDLVAVDWQARLLQHLRKSGFEVQLKPHPESHCPPPAAFQERLAVELVEGPCEAVMPRADVLLFDYPGATCFLHALKGDRPIVLIEFPHLRLDPEARALLERRVALVPGYLDERGRASVDWAALDSALAMAPLRRDRGFVEAYFPQL